MKVRLHAVVGEKLVRVETSVGIQLDVNVPDELWGTIDLLRALGIEGLRQTPCVIRKDQDTLSLLGWTLDRILEQKPEPTADN